MAQTTPSDAATPVNPGSRLSDADRWRLFVSRVADYALFMLTPEGYVHSWNEGAQRIKGYAASEIIGQHFSRFYTAEDRAIDKPARALRTALEEGKFEDEGWRVRKDGTRFWASVVIDPIRDDDGVLIGFAKITRDLTERREAALALERAKEALFQSQKLEAIGKLTGGVAHDFNNLLAVIVSGLELLAQEVQSPAAVKVLDSMDRAATRGAMLTRQLLAFARQQPLRKERHNLNQVIGAFEAVLRRACGELVSCRLMLDPRLRPVMIDATQFEAALLNLVTNARDAMSEGGSIHIATENVELPAGKVGTLAAGNYVKVTVIDNGTGMPPEVAARAIDPFFTTKEIGKGTGMGLSQVYGLAQQSDGDIVIDTQVGKGTSISLFLPALAPAEGDAETLVGNDIPGTELALVVDDVPDVLEIAVTLFKQMGFEVLSANTGRDALEVLQRTPNVGVLFSDVLMPGMSGIELGHEARKLVPGIKVVLASGYPAPAIASEHTDFASFAFVSKPYRLAELAKVLRKAD
ncbi:MAG TPA: ATP-binding protein [Noviherbaspirillum sp.]